MDPVTMMVASIGMQFFTQHATSKKNAEIQEKQREFQKAAAEHDFERMRKLQAESARLALELEAEVHKERVEDINNNYDALLENFAHSFAIQNWPLNVLPFVMKGESFGSLFNGTTQSVNMHCILTPSNCEWFNAMFYDDIDLRLEAELNNNWNAQTTHPVIYYGGGWNRRTMRHGISVPDEINLVDIDLLKVKLKNIPVVVITPYFDHDSSSDTGSWLQFRVQIWGMGKDSDTPFRIEIPHGKIEYSKRIFSYDYNKDVKDKISNDFINTTIEEFVPYLESMIGFLADKYFWSMYGVAPKLPLLLTNKQSSIYNLSKYYIHKYKDYPLERVSSINDFCKAIDYIFTENIFTEKEINDICENLHTKYLKKYSSENSLCMNDLFFLEKMKKNITNRHFREILQKEIDSISKEEKLGIWFCANVNEFYQKILNTRKTKGIFTEKFMYQIKSNYISIGYFVDDNNLKVYTLDNIGDYIILMNTMKKIGAYEINLTTMKATECSSQPTFSNIDIDNTQLKETYRSNKIWLGKLIERHNEVKDIISRYLVNAPTQNITYEDLKKWSLKHSEVFESANFIIAYNPNIANYYIVGLTSNKQNVFAAYCNTIDESLKKSLGNNLILTIKNK